MPRIPGVLQRCPKTCPRFRDGCRRHKWGYHVELPPGPDGKRRQLTGSGYPSQREAADARDADVRLHRHEQRPTGSRRVTVGDYLDAWLERRTSGPKPLSPNTLLQYRIHVDHYIKPVIGHVRRDQLTADQVEAMVSQVPVIGAERERAQREEWDAKRRAREEAKAARWAAGGKPGPKPKPKNRTERPPRRTHDWARTQLLVFGTLRAALNSAVKRDGMPSNPCLRTDIDTRLSRRADVPWDLERLRTYLDSVAEHVLGPLLVLAAMTGLRRGELCALAWDDITFADCPTCAGAEKKGQRACVACGGRGLAGAVLVVRWSATVNVHRVIMRPVKSPAGRLRRVQVDADTALMLRRLHTRQVEQRLAVGEGWPEWEEQLLRGGQEWRPMFRREDGRAWHPRLVWEHHAALCERAGLPHIRVHDLRHMSASLGAAAGESLLACSRRLGHSQIAITADLYSHEFDVEAKSAAEARAKRLGRG